MRAAKRPNSVRPITLVLGMCAIACGPGPTRIPPPSKQALNDPWKAAITRQVRPYLDSELVTGLVVGVIDGDREWIYGYGSAGNGPAAPDAQTVFELGGVTQVYNAVLLADAIERGEVTLATPATELVPMGITLPTRDGVEITIRHLATHRAGLPDLPPGLAERPPATYNVDHLYADLVRTRLFAPPGAAFAFSNFGVAVLGTALAAKLGTTGWPAAVAERVTQPLGLADTVVTVPAALAPRHAVGHSDDGRVVPFANLGALAPAAGLRSTAKDQLAFLRANLDAAAGKPGPLAAALRRTHEPLDPGRRDQVALGWFVDEAGRRYQRGHTGGFHAFIELDLDRRRAVVILAATATSLVDELGDAILAVVDGAPPAPRTFTAPEALMRYVGTYRIGTAGDVDLVVELDGQKLMAKLGAERFRLVPVEDRFYIEALRAFARFEGDPPATLTIEVPGQPPVVAERIAAPEPPPTTPPAPTPTP
jgi:CubicO group peptidase (beta-lactamase class C family)